MSGIAGIYPLQIRLAPRQLWRRIRFTRVRRHGVWAAVGLDAREARFDDFDADNDPRDEHDFGSFELEGEKLFWKIDLYERELVKPSWWERRKNVAHLRVRCQRAPKHCCFEDDDRTLSHAL